MIHEERKSAFPTKCGTAKQGKNMTITKTVAGRVNSAVKTKGRSYFASRRVKIMYGDPFHVQAEVNGSEVYDVEINRTAKKLKVGCTCPYFDSNQAVCKHIWATLLAAEAQNYLAGAPGQAGSGKLKIQIDADFLTDNYEDDEEEFDDFDGFSVEDDGDFEDEWHERPPVIRFQPPKKKRIPKPPSWKQQLAVLRDPPPVSSSSSRMAWPPGREILYIIDRQAALEGKGLVLEIAHRDCKQNGDWSKPKLQTIEPEQIATLPDLADRHILSILGGADKHNRHGSYYDSYGYSSGACKYVLGETLLDHLLPMVSQTGRWRLRVNPDAELQEIRWNDGPSWEFWLEVAKTDDKQYELNGTLRRGQERMPLAVPTLLIQGGLVFWQDQVARLNDRGAFGWIRMLRDKGVIQVPLK
jgi:hypothetical protein